MVWWLTVQRIVFAALRSCRCTRPRPREALWLTRRPPCGRLCKGAKEACRRVTHRRCVRRQRVVEEGKEAPDGTEDDVLQLLHAAKFLVEVFFHPSSQQHDNVAGLSLHVLSLAAHPNMTLRNLRKILAMPTQFVLFDTRYRHRCNIPSIDQPVVDSVGHPSRLRLADTIWSEKSQADRMRLRLCALASWAVAPADAESYGMVLAHMWRNNACERLFDWCCASVVGVRKLDGSDDSLLVFRRHERSLCSVGNIGRPPSPRLDREVVRAELRAFLLSAMDCCVHSVSPAMSRDCASPRHLMGSPFLRRGGVLSNRPWAGRRLPLLLGSTLEEALAVWSVKDVRTVRTDVYAERATVEYFWLPNLSLHAAAKIFGVWSPDGEDNERHIAEERALEALDCIGIAPPVIAWCGPTTEPVRFCSTYRGTQSTQSSTTLSCLSPSSSEPFLPLMLCMLETLPTEI
jgi:hypothetical protein